VVFCLLARNDGVVTLRQCRPHHRRIAVMEPILNSTMSIDEIMRKWPATVHVAISHHLLCVGCPIGPFHTIADAAREHGLDEAMLRREFEAAIASDQGGQRPKLAS
jgi:hybrid cluster-associated redox disulfide protein